jgi:hypothetical protein
MVAAQFDADFAGHRGRVPVSDIFTEVDEEVRRDQAFKYWQRYGKFVIAGAVAIVVATGGYVAYRDWSRKQAMAEGARFIAAADLAAQGQAAPAATAFADIAKDGPAGYAALARLRAAALKAEAGDAAGAAEMYRAIAADSSIEHDLRDAATILAALQVAGSADPAELEKQLAPLTTPRNAWRHAAWEIMAVAAARSGDTSKARELYTKIADDAEAPAGMRARAAEMLAVLGG